MDPRAWPSRGPGRLQSHPEGAGLLAGNKSALALGVSNVSFGLRTGQDLNAAMLTLALRQRPFPAIANPMDPVLLDAAALLALSGEDPGCAAIIARFAAKEQSEKAAVPDMTLQEAVIRGSRPGRRPHQELLKSLPPLRIIDEPDPRPQPGGSAFETGKCFCSAIMSADAASAGFSASAWPSLHSGSRDKGTSYWPRCGNIHDIGKNIVRALLEK